MKKKKKKCLTFDSKVQMEEPIACKTSTAELTAFFTEWISACKTMEMRTMETVYLY